MSERETDGRAPISRASGISIGLAIAALVVTASGAWAVSGFWATWGAWTTSTDARLLSIERKVDASGEDRWRGMDMVRWTERLREHNPGLEVPSPFTEPGR